MIIIFLFGCELPMTDINKLKEEELNELNRVNVEAEEVGLEELIVLGEHKKILIHITYPNPDNTKTKVKALVRQLTLKELEGIKFNGANPFVLNKRILQKAFFKSTGERFSNAELEVLPIGVVNEVANTILELSGIDTNTSNQLRDF